MRYKNILVISDNYLQCNRFCAIEMELFDHAEVEFTYACSPYSDEYLFDDFVKQKMIVVDMKDDQMVDNLIRTYDLIFSMHCKQLFPPKLVNNVKCINIHPGYNPINRGWFPQVFAIINDLELGVTIHEIDEELDHGPIIARQKVPLYEWDTSLTAYNRVLLAEIDLLREYLVKIINGQYKSVVAEDDGNIFYKQDFKDLCEIDLKKKGTYREVINRLRALSHGNYNNAFYCDDDGKRIFLKLQIDKEK
jgi:methionyl-tRNA formyltransferase